MVNKIKMTAILMGIITLLGCNNNHNNLANSTNDTAALKNIGQEKEPYLSNVFNASNDIAFSPMGCSPDSLIFVFYKFNRTSDTTWGIATYKMDSFVYIKVNEVTPKIIAEGFTMNKDTLFFKKFDGYSCRISVSFWNELIKECELESYIPKNQERRNIVGGSSYSLYYKSKVIVDSREDVPYLKRVNSIFTKYIISKINYRAAHPPSKYDGDATH